MPLLIHALAVDDGGWLVTPSCPAWGGSRFLMDGWCRCSCGLPRACCTSADEFPRPLAPPASGGTPVVLAFDVANAAAVFAQAVRAGAAIRQPLSDMFWGDRHGQHQDPFGHRFNIAQHLRDVPHGETVAGSRTCV